MPHTNPHTHGSAPPAFFECPAGFTSAHAPAWLGGRGLDPGCSPNAGAHVYCRGNGRTCFGRGKLSLSTLPPGRERDENRLGAGGPGDPAASITQRTAGAQRGRYFSDPMPRAQRQQRSSTGQSNLLRSGRPDHAGAGTSPGTPERRAGPGAHGAAQDTSDTGSNRTTGRPTLCDRRADRASPQHRLNLQPAKTSLRA